MGSVVANAALFLLLIVYSACRSTKLVLGVALAASVSATLFLGGCALAGALLYEHSHALGNILMAAVSVGYYPNGPDVPLVPGFSLWSATSVGVIFAGLASGILLRRYPRNESRDDG
jgi:hypothetical protein